MPETACLHIQARDSDPIRVVELPGSSVRIGRASYCEVRLSEPDLADEECRLKRRGGIWQLVPSRAAGFVWIDGRSVESTCALPFDVPFQVGEHSLTLRPTGTATPEWRAYKSPEPSSSTLIREEVRPPVAVPRGRDDSTELFEFLPPPARPTPTPEYDHLSRWKGRQEKRPSRSDVTPEERRWENRWRAAGERVRARPTLKASPIASPPLATPPVATPPVVAPPIVSTPLVPPTPVAASPTEDSALRRAPFAAADLRERARRGTAPVDLRVTVAEVPPVVPPVPPLTAPLVESTPRTTPAFQAPDRPRIEPPTIENRSSLAPEAAWQAEPTPSAADSLSAHSLTWTSSAPAFDEAIAVSVRELPLPESPPVGLDPLAPEVEFDEVNDDETSFVDDTLAPEETSETPVVEEAAVPLFENLELAPLAQENELVAAVTPANDESLASQLGTEPVAAVPDEVLAPGLGTEPESGSAVGTEGLVSGPSAEAEAVGVAGTESPVSELGTEPVAAVGTERLDSGPDAEPFAEATHATPLTSKAPSESIRTGRGFVTDASPADFDDVIVAKSQVDLTTSVHDACGQPRSAAARSRPPLSGTNRPASQPDTVHAQTALPTSEWSPPLDPTERLGSGATGSETIPPPSSRDWPTVRDILASHNASVRRASAASSTARAVSTQPMLTEYREPAHWSLPAWLGFPPALVVVLVLGLAGFALSWIWSVDARWSGSVASLLAGGGVNVKPLPTTVPTPSGSWWKSTPANLMLWSLYYDRLAVDEPVNAEQANELLGAAAHASPIQPQVRFAMARRAATEGEDPELRLGSSLGLSHDIEAQTWLGRQLLAAGKKEAALKVYRSALEMAARVKLSRSPPPAFDDDTEVLRYLLPGEDVSGRVIRDMAEQTGWTFSDWKEALPSFAPIPLSAARLLRKQGSSDADAALDLILTRLDVPAPEGTSAPVHLAAQAEALALKSNWKEAESLYRAAIEQMPNDLIKRSWWMNLAEIDRRLNDDAGRQIALGLARGSTASDEISQRAVDLLRFAGSRADKARAQR